MIWWSSGQRDGCREREQQSRKWVERERESAYKERWLREIIKKIERSEYFIEISCKIEELI